MAKALRRLGRAAAMLCALVGVLGTAGLVQAQVYFDWQAHQSAPTGFFTDVELIGTNRVFSGYEIDPFTYELEAKVYTTTGPVGSAPPIVQDLGFTSGASVALSLANNDAGGYRAVATDLTANFEYRAYIFDSADIANPLAVIGPPPALNPDVRLNAINDDGLAVGSVGGVQPLLAHSGGVRLILPHIYPAELFGVDSSGKKFGGASERPNGDPERVAAIFELDGTIAMLDDMPGIVLDVEGSFAVGQSGGRAAWWRRQTDGSWQRHYVRGPLGAALDGELRAIDHVQGTIGGGFVQDGRPVVVNLIGGQWVDLEAALGIGTDQLYSVVGISVDETQLALAVEGEDVTGWEVTALLANPLPGPGAWAAAALAVAGLSLGRHPWGKSRGRRSTQNVAHGKTERPLHRPRTATHEQAL